MDRSLFITITMLLCCVALLWIGVQYAQLRMYIYFAHQQRVDLVDFIKANKRGCRPFSDWFEYMD